MKTALMMIALCGFWSVTTAQNVTSNQCEKIKGELPRKTLRDLMKAERIVDFRSSINHQLAVARRHGSGLVVVMDVKDNKGRVVYYEIATAADCRCVVEAADLRGAVK